MSSTSRIPGLRGTGVVGHAAAVVIAAAATVAVVGRMVAPNDPDRADISNAYVGSSPEHWLGFDGQGRDIFSRILVGARISLAAGFASVAIGGLIGTALGLLAGYYEGWWDRIVMRISDVLFAFPGILLAVLVAAVFGASLTTAALALAVAYTPYIARVVRSAAAREREQPYIAALEVQGHSSWSICIRHLVPNVLPLVVAQATIVFGYAMVDLAAISFIGLGVQAPDTDWGLMVASGQPGTLQGYLAESFSAGLCIVIVVVAFNLLGERLADRTPEQR